VGHVLGVKLADVDGKVLTAIFKDEK
jgi:hypothetical protein